MEREDETRASLRRQCAVDLAYRCCRSYIGKQIHLEAQTNHS
jgi:hypothetical protein